jgi:hypothetical protein
MSDYYSSGPAAWLAGYDTGADSECPCPDHTFIAAAWRNGSQARIAEDAARRTLAAVARRVTAARHAAATAVARRAEENS